MNMQNKKDEDVATGEGGGIDGTEPCRANTSGRRDLCAATLDQGGIRW